MTIASIESESEPPPERAQEWDNEDACGQERRRSSALSLLVGKWERAKEVVWRKDSANSAADAQLDGATAEDPSETVQRSKRMSLRERTKKVPGLSRLVDAIVPGDPDGRYYTYDPTARGWHRRVRGAEDEQNGIDASPTPQRSQLRREACAVETLGQSTSAEQEDFDAQKSHATAHESVPTLPPSERSLLRPPKRTMGEEETTLSARPDVAGAWGPANEAEEAEEDHSTELGERSTGSHSRESDPLDVPGSALSDGRRRINAQEELERLGL